MAQSDNNIPTIVKKLHGDVEQLQAELARVEAQNDQLRTDIALLVRTKEEAEARAAMAEQSAREAEENLAKLRALADGQYKSVVEQLFSEPSKEAARHTFFATAASIAVALLVTIWSVQYSLRRSAEDSAALRKALSATLGESAAQSREETSQELHNTEARMTQSVQSAFQRVLSKPPSGAEIVELPRNVVLQRTVAPGQDLYFRVAVPANTPRLDVRLWPLTGNADLYYRYGEAPLPDAPSAAVCASVRRSTEMDSCYTVSPLVGDWYMRVRGASSEYSTFVIQAGF